MDNLEGGILMNTYPTVLKIATIPNPTLQLSREVSLVREQEASILPQEDKVDIQVEKVPKSKNLADTLLHDTKNVGISETLIKLSRGEYRENSNSSNTSEAI
jgi:hypothetical protein